MPPEVKPEQFAVLVRDIPPFPVDQTRKAQVDSFFKIIYPEIFYRLMVVTKNKEVRHFFCYVLFFLCINLTGRDCIVLEGFLISYAL